MNSLQKLRLQFQPLFPRFLQNLQQVTFVAKQELLTDENEIHSLFPCTYGHSLFSIENGVNKRVPKCLKVGVVFSGGQAPGGHNVLAGLYDALKSLHPESTLWGFLEGPSGILANQCLEITSENLAPFRNQGGFDLLGSGRVKIETEDQLKACLSTSASLSLDGLVIIGGDDSNTNAALLAEYFLREKCSTKVIGVPKTIDGDLKNPHVAISFGFDTACKIYAEMIGNICRDALSAKKYTHFIKLMGRSASHIAMECALKTHPNLTLISEEIQEKQTTLAQLISQIADLIQHRAEQGKNYSILLIPEGIIEFIPEIKGLITELNQRFADENKPDKESLLKHLTPEKKELFSRLPNEIQKQLLEKRDPHGNVQVSLIETERLLIQLTENELEDRAKKGLYRGKFSPVAHFLGYEGRAGFPSNFDCNYCYTLGMTSALLIDEGLTGYMAYVENLENPPGEWKIGGLPLVSLLHMETRHGKNKPVIKKALVDTQAKAFHLFDELRGQWATQDDYQWPGPMQFSGDATLTDTIPIIITIKNP